MQSSITTQLMLSLEPLKQRHFACVCVFFYIYNSELKENMKKKTLRGTTPLPLNQNKEIKGIDGEFDLICRSLGLSGSTTSLSQPHHSPPQQSRFFYFYSYSYSFAVQPVKLDERMVRVGSVTAGPSQGINVLSRLWWGSRWRLITPQLRSC